ncbi:MAG: gamma-glutamyl phosphate reductase [Actinomycetia bacterium]|nr:gamma-glutamyl phosphate reductase [Actinomycetes bacterium]
MSLRELVAAEARLARAAVPHLNDVAVSHALREAATAVAERGDAILAANELDLSEEEGVLDPGTIDRLRLDGPRLNALAEQLTAMADLEPLPREGAAWTLPNGLAVSELRIPIGVVGANFEARPNVALDIAAQLLKSLNAGVMRTGGAALRTVTVLVDDVLRPSLEATGLPPGAVGLVRSPDREGARVLVSLPHEIPLVILRGSGETTAALAKRAAEHGVRALAHAEGGGVLYLHGSAAEEKVQHIVEQSLDRLGVCNRLNLLLIDHEARHLLPCVLGVTARLGIEARATERARTLDRSRLAALDERLGHEWANDAERVATMTVDLVDDLGEAAAIANHETSGLAAGIVAEDEAAAEAFLNAYRGTAAFWHATTRFTDGFALTGAPETGINVDWSPGPRGPVTYRDLWLRQYRIIGDATQTR